MALRRSAAELEGDTFDFVWLRLGLAANHAEFRVRSTRHAGEKETEPLPPHPFEVAADDLASHLDEMVDVTFADIQSQFLIRPRGQNFIEFGSFQDAYEAQKQETDAFGRFNDETVWKALDRNALVKDQAVVSVARRSRW